MFLLLLCLLALAIKTECCESKTFQNTRITVSDRNKNNPKDVIVSECIEYNNETKDYFTIEVISQSLNRLQKGTFVDLPVLSLKLTNNVIRHVDKGSFQRLRTLQNIDLSKNQIKTIHKDVFNDLISLEKLALSENRIEDIEELAFAHLVSLTELLLSKNKIAVWNSQWFVNNNRLRTLDFEENLLESLPDSAFTNTPQLNTLVLRSNRLKEIHPNVFNGLASLTMLDLSENQLIKLHKDTFAPFSGRKVNGEANSNSNRLGFGFGPMFGLWNLYIHRNNLTFLADEIMNDLASSRGFHMLTLYSNPWQCGCYAKIVKWTTEHSLRLNIWGKGCYHSDNPVCIVPKEKPKECLEEIEEDIRSLYYSLYKHYTFYDGTDFKVRCNPI